jgi:hypothetical protein
MRFERRGEYRERIDALREDAGEARRERAAERAAEAREEDARDAEAE